jgi:glycosyltransferase involved in cell wall biosynthesis
MISNATTRFIFLIDSRGVIQEKKDDSQRRHIDYAKNLSLRNSEYNFQVISAIESQKKSDVIENFQQHYIKCNKRLSIKYVLKTVQIIRKTKPFRVVLIAGDPWEAAINTYIIANILKKIYNIKCLIQLQIHADICDKAWRRSSFTNKARYYLAYMSLTRANQIRVVSEKLKNGVIKDFSVNESKIIIAPVELNFPKKIELSFHKDRPRSIGFAGRFHKDRSVNEFVEYIKKLDSVCNNFSVVLAGEGELLNDTLSRLSKILPLNRLEYCGNLSGSEMQMFWRKIGVYVSLAKSESFGRSIREAAYLGVPILATKSNGFDALRELKCAWIREVDLEDSPEVLHSQIEVMFSVETDGLVREILVEEAEKFSHTLIDSWINLFDD